MATPTTLVLATSGPHGEVGLLASPGGLETTTLGAGAARGRGLMPAVENLLARAHLGAADLEGIVVDVGPGSFTGTRVGVTTAKTLAYALGIPVVGVLSLDALARQAPDERPVLALRDAGRGRLYAARYGPRRDGVRTVFAPPARRPAEEALAEASDLLAVGEDVGELLAGHASAPRERLDVAADAAAVLAEGAPALAAGQAAPAHVLAPVYLQASAPEQRLAGEDRSGGVSAPLHDRSH